MATTGKDLSSIAHLNIENCADFRIGIVVSKWNDFITNRLLEGALETFKLAGVPSENIQTIEVPGAFELPFGAQHLLQNTNVDGVLTIGVVIQGETKHFDFVCSGTTSGIMDVMLKHNKPVSFCLLTDLNEQQSIDRSGGKHGNKGVECAGTLLHMIHLNKK